MTKKIAVSLPDDVAERLIGKSNVSAFVTDALRWRFAAEEIRAQLRSVGYDITDEHVAKARADFEEERARVRANPELRLAAEKLHAEVTAGRRRR